MNLPSHQHHSSPPPLDHLPSISRSDNGHLLHHYLSCLDMYYPHIVASQVSSIVQDGSVTVCNTKAMGISSKDNNNGLMTGIEGG